MSELNIQIDPILWDWWKEEGESDDEAINDLFLLFLENYYEEHFTPYSPKKIRDITVEVPEKTIEECSEYIDKYGLDSFINGCLRWARMEEEKLKSIFKFTNH